MKVLIVGGGTVGQNLAYYLMEQQRHVVTLVEQQEHVTRRLASELSGVTIVEGDGCDPAVLREAGAETMDAVAAVTGDDEDNLVISLLSKREFRVGRVAARINNPKNAWLFTSRMGVDVPVDATRLIARSLEADINIGTVVQMLKLREGQATLVELNVARGSGAIGKAVQALGLPPDCILVALLRADRVVIPSGDTIIEAGDEVLAIARLEHEAALAERFR
jgi:trk system potassium uptake protein TrkA